MKACKWAIGIGAGIIIGAAISHKVYTTKQKKKCSQVDMEEMLDDDIVPSTKTQSTDNIADSDDELYSDEDLDLVYDIGKTLMGITKKKMSYTERLKENARILKLSPRTRKDMLFYNIFACYTESACDKSS